VPVRFIGGGPVGFCLALELAFHGQRSTVVEQDAGTGLELRAKAGTLNERTMFIDKEGTWANMTTVNGVDLWRFILLGAEEKLDLARLDMRKEINRAFGRDDIPYEVMPVLPWRRAQTHAVRYRDGRVLLAGDACHTTSSTGGYGLNTGIGDVASVGWMLDAEMSGWGGRHLLDAHEIERRPVASRNLGNSTENYEVWLDHTGYERVFDEGTAGNASRRAVGARLAAALRQEWHSLGIGMGYNYYCSPIVYPDGSKGPPDDPSEYDQTSRPGHRAPHAWLPDGRSTLDLFGHGFTLLILGANPPATAAIEQAALRIGFPLTAHALPQPEIAALDAKKLVLVRPEGIVAWRGDSLPADNDELRDIVRGSPVGAQRQRGSIQDTPALRKTA